MRALTRAVTSLIIVALAACTPEDPEGQGTTDTKSTTATGPCVGDICLGSDGASYLSNCPENSSVSSAVEIRVCPTHNQLSVAGATATSGEVIIADGKAARLRLLFDGGSCSLLKSSLSKSLGESSFYAFTHDDYKRLYESIGDSSGGLTSSLIGQQWQSKNGQFVLVGDGSEFGGTCELRVDSTDMARNLERKIRSEAENSIKG